MVWLRILRAAAVLLMKRAALALTLPRLYDRLRRADRRFLDDLPGGKS